MTASSKSTMPCAGQAPRGTPRALSVDATELAFLAPPSASAQPVSWRLVCQTCSGKLYLHQVSLVDTNTRVEALEKLKLEYQRLMSLPPYHLWDKTPIFFSPFIDSAILSVNSTSDLEAQLETLQVFVTRRQRERELTAAFNAPALLSNAKDFVQDNARFKIGNAGAALEREVLLVGLRMNWIGLLFLVLLNWAILIGVGVVVGIATRDVNLGVAVTSGVAAIVACVQAVLFWYLSIPDESSTDVCY